MFYGARLWRYRSSAPVHPLMPGECIQKGKACRQEKGKKEVTFFQKS